MNNVTICTPMRDSSPRLDAYIARVNALDYPSEQLRIVIAEGDSVDDTGQRVQMWAREDPRVTMVHADTGKPRYGSVVHPERFEVLAHVFNAALAQVDTAWSTHVLFLPDDISFEPDLLHRLLAHNVAIVAPLVWGDWYGNAYFYDTWAFSRKNIGNFYNFSRAWANDNLPQGLIEMDTVGGTMLMRSLVIAAGCRYTPQEVDRGLCKMASAYGFDIWCDTMTNVRHGA